MVERWLAEISGAPATKAHARAVFGMVFRHAIRYEYTFINPIASVRQTRKRMFTPVMLELTEICDLLRELWTHPEPCFTLVFTAVVTGLRRGELIGLKWSDIDFEKKQINIVRCWVNKIVGEPKTNESGRQLLKPES
ncbi:tyrosine-type recombinase/integrase [Terriglobus sp. YAF25]|uniref:tyrosine-type recombinase/integrase n=1 Tax=Terriglobus sp. YAF25 TaxID=3233080 RepID=UPI003F99FBEA